MDSMNEIETMRQQLAQLKQRLDREANLNESLLHDSLRTKMRTLRADVRRVIIIGFVGICAWGACGEIWNLSPYFVALTCLMMLASITAEYLINRMKDDDLSTNLTETLSRLVRMKRLRVRQIMIGYFVLFVIWLPLLIREFYLHTTHEEFRIIVPGLVLGIVLGGIIGTTIFVKMQRTNDEMIRQIRDSMA